MSETDPHTNPHTEPHTDPHILALRKVMLESVEVVRFGTLSSIASPRPVAMVLQVSEESFSYLHAAVVQLTALSLEQAQRPPTMGTDGTPSEEQVGGEFEVFYTLSGPQDEASEQEEERNWSLELRIYFALRPAVGALVRIPLPGALEAAETLARSGMCLVSPESYPLQAGRYFRLRLPRSGLYAVLTHYKYTHAPQAVRESV